MKTTFVITALVALALTPLVSANSMGTICTPPSINVCVEYGTQNRSVYRPDASVGGWEYQCHLDMVCLRTPEATVGREYLTSAPIPYAYVYCPGSYSCFSSGSEIDIPALLA